MSFFLFSAQCRADGTHDLIWLKKRNETCTGGVDIPPTSYDISCSILFSFYFFLIIMARWSVITTLLALIFNLQTSVTNWFWNILDITCLDGQYLPLGTSECNLCDAGTYSRGGATIVDTWYFIISFFKILIADYEKGIPGLPNSGAFRDIANILICQTNPWIVLVGSWRMGYYDLDILMTLKLLFGSCTRRYCPKRAYCSY